MLAILLASAAGLTTPALAQSPASQPPPQRPTTTPAAADAHSTHAGHEDEIVVTGRYVQNLDLLAGTSVLDGADLQRDIRGQLGDTLAKLPGVSATSFSPGASRPVLRGFQGERIRVLTDGIGSIDVSNTSADHAVTIDPLTAERIEVLHGPAVLLFGGQAIGGAVNVIDRRIPHVVPEGGYHVDVLGSLSSAADERSVGAGADIALGQSGFVAHLDGSWRKSDDLRTGGYLLSPQLRAEQLEIAEEELAEGHPEEAVEALALADQRGRIPNSQTEQKGFGAGLSFIRDTFEIGGSVGRFESVYGVPARPGAEHHHGEGEGEDAEEGAEEAPVSIDLKQTRYDLRAEYSPDAGFLEKIRFRGATAKYRHTEFEGDEVGTVFRNKGLEARFELVQRDRNGWRGASGAQYFRRNFQAVGAEAFLPANKTNSFGLFTLQEFTLGKVGLEGSLRYDSTQVESDILDFDRSFSAISGAAGASYAIAPQAKLGINLSRTTRAPSAEELLSNGPHIATQAFEVGDPDLRKERSVGAEAYVRLDRRDWKLSLTGFANWFDDFIYDDATGAEEDGLPVFQYFQRDATYYGVEAQASATLTRIGGFTIVGDAVADYVRATIKGVGPVPRIPPFRLLAGLEAQSTNWDGRVEVERVAGQDRTAAFELPTEGFTMVNASIAWRPWGKNRETAIMLSANNIFDVEARRHASFTKDFVPLAGRDIRLSARFSF
ncbi:TonB-dependent receptor [Sphingomonas lutea]|uniref:TonB-dependent receptor n=1 Tax=Sphingomonas lutea TaxID=1045317 RepID=A0A7G9SLC5_9SPHN|nr:TonB-dependent receptor [Sphingomonas lutea]